MRTRVVKLSFMMNVALHWALKDEQEQRSDAKCCVSDTEEEGQFRWENLGNK